MTHPSAIARALLARRGIDPAQIEHLAGDWSIHQVPRADPGWLAEQATGVMERAIPAEYATATVTHPDIAAWVDAHLADPAAAGSLLLVGETGTTKTSQAWAALRHIVMYHAHRGRRLIWRATNCPTLNAACRPHPDGSHAYALDPYLSAELLLLDDLAAGKQNEWTADSLYRLVEHRWSRRLPTIYITNLNAVGLAEAVGDDRVVSRLIATTCVMVRGEDRRQDGGTP